MIWSPGYKLAHMTVEFITGLFIKSPLEKDFGDPSEDDIVPPEAAFTVTLPSENPCGPIVKSLSQFHSVKPERLDKLVTRMKELPPNKDSQIRFQISDQIPTTELLIDIFKDTDHSLIITAHSSQKIIDQLSSTLNTP